MTKRRLVYFGTPAEAVPPLLALHAAGYPIALVVTRADARRGRRGSPTASPVKAAALELGIEVSHELDGVADTGATLGVVVAYGRIIPAELLARVPMVNLHFSQLPRWRGAAPVERAILSGDETTAVAVMHMEAGLDTGPIHAETIVPIRAGVTAAELRADLVDTGARLLVETLDAGLSEPPRPQVGEAVYAHKITSADRSLNLAEDSDMWLRRIRIGKAWTTFRGDRLIIAEAAPHDGPDPDVITGDAALDQAAGPPGSVRRVGARVLLDLSDGAIELRTVQPAGKGQMDATSWWNGVQPGSDRLGSSDIGAQDG